MRANQTRQLLQQGKAALGCAVVQTRSAEIPRMFAAAGFDWAFIDTEHGGFTIEADILDEAVFKKGGAPS